MRFAWHGAGCSSLEAGGRRFTVDPYFSRPGTYGDWYVPNRRAPTPEQYLRDFRPDYVVITHGHFDHFDPEAIKWIDAAAAPRYIATPEATRVLEAVCGVPAERCLPLEPDGSLTLDGGLVVRAWRGAHWFTGPEGDEAAKKLAHHYGAMPSGGAMLEILVTGRDGKAFVSGDTRLEGIPDLGGCRLAVVNVGTRMSNPRTKVPEAPILTLADVPAVVERLRPRTLAPVHWDVDGWLEPFDLEACRRAAEAARPGTGVLTPEPNVWVDVP